MPRCAHSACVRPSERGCAITAPRLGVVEEVGDLAFLVGGVERQVDEPGAQAAEVEQQRLGGFLHLHRDAVAGLEAQRPRGATRSARSWPRLRRSSPRAPESRSSSGARAVRGKARCEERVEVGVRHRVSMMPSFTSASATPAATASAANAAASGSAPSLPEDRRDRRARQDLDVRAVHHAHVRGGRGERHVHAAAGAVEDRESPRGRPRGAAR